MLKKILPNIMNKYLTKSGPYILCFNFPLDEKNQYIVKFLNHKSTVNPQITFIEVDWNGYYSYVCGKTTLKPSCIYLYYEKEIVKMVENFNIIKIEEIITLSLKYYIKNINKKIENTGLTREKKLIELSKSDPVTSYIMNQDKRYIKYRKNRLAKIKIDNDMINSNDPLRFFSVNNCKTEKYMNVNLSKFVEITSNRGINIPLISNSSYKFHGKISKYMGLYENKKIQSSNIVNLKDKQNLYRTFKIKNKDLIISKKNKTEKIRPSVIKYARTQNNNNTNSYSNVNYNLEKNNH